MIYFVATPIGNLEDMTLRAIRILGESHIIYCEDTRSSRKLLDHYDIKTRLSSYHKFNEEERVKEIIDKAKDGLDISIISDAGMPGISDPGNILIKALIKEGIDYTVLPGPSAFTTALVMSGFDSEKFSFYGFFPTKESEKKDILERVKVNKSTAIFYESPHRIMKTLDYLAQEIPDHTIGLVREISKIYEDLKIFKACEFKSIDLVEKGEMVLLIDRDDSKEEIDEDFIKEKIQSLLDEGLSKKSAIKILSKELKLNKNKLYEISLEI